MRGLIRDKSIKKILILAILLRVLLIPFFYHPDIKTYSFQVSFLKRGIVNIYPFLLEHRSELPLKEEFVYLPATYLFLGGYQAAVSPLLGDGFDKWLANADSSSVTDPGVYRYLFLLKLPYLIVDIGLAFLLTQFFGSVENKKKVLILWLFNPFSIILIYIFSNIDILPVFLSVWSLLLAKNKKLVLSALLLGLAALFKAYTFLFLPFLLLYSDSWKERVLMVVSSAGIFIIGILPFYSQAFVSSALFSGLTNRLIESAIPLAFGENIILTIFLLTLLFFYLIRKKLDLTIVYTVIFLILYSFIHFNIQWLLWTLPFVCLTLIKNKSSAPTFVFLGVIAFLIPLFYNDKSMNVALFSAISPLYATLPTPFSIVQKFYDPVVIQSVLHTFLAAGSLFISWELLKEKLWEF